jgi:hypothetical protein
VFIDTVKPIQCLKGNDDHTFTATGRMRAASPSLLCHWVARAWDTLDEEIIRRLFLKTGIANKLDGTENDWLWMEPGDTGSVTDADRVQAFEAVDSDSASNDDRLAEDSGFRRIRK